MTPGHGDDKDSGVVMRYLEGIVAHDWEAVASCLAEDVVRIGPFGDTYSGRRTYLDFLSGLMPTLQEYSMRVDRLETEGRLAVVELTETMSIEGRTVATPEALLFDLDARGLIGRIGIYIQRPGQATRTDVD